MPMHVRVERGPNAGSTFPLREGLNGIGRGDRNAIALTDDKVSSEHARIDVDAAGGILTDLGSTNGTLLNDAPLTRPTRLRPGDTVQVGNTVLTYDEGEIVGERLTSRIKIVVDDDDTRAMMPIAWAPEATTELLPLIAGDLEAEELHELYGLLTALYRVTSLVSRSATLDELLANVLEVVMDIVPADGGSMVFGDDPRGPLRPRAGLCRGTKDHTIRVSETIVRDVLDTGRGVLTRDATEDERFRGGDSIQLYGIRSAMCVPVRTHRQLFGVIYLDTRSLDRQFTERDLELLTAIGTEVGLAVENFQLFQQNLEAERLAAIGQAIAGLSHYIKNIVQSMDAARFLIHTAIEDNDREALGEAWDALDRNTELISELVLNMLSYSRHAQPDYETCAPNTVAAQLVELVTPRAEEKGTRFELDLDPAMPTAVLDTGAVHRSLLNLFTNAIDATGQGTVRVATRWDPATCRVEFRVSDSGPGIPAEHRESIFKAFFTTKGSRGTGLGLAVTRKLVEELGGDITFESEPGRGATFAISLPVSPAVLESEA